MAEEMKYAEVMVDWLSEMGYTHCFFVAGGNAMHLLDAVRTRMTCVPMVHEVSAGIAAEYFNEVSPDKKAFVVVTAGPGLTNIVTAVAGAYLENRELLVLGGQVKTSDLATGGLRQRGIQEIAGQEIVSPITVVSERLTAPLSRPDFEALVARGYTGRPGPVFLEVCLDVQGQPVVAADLEGSPQEVAGIPSLLDAGDAVAAIAQEFAGSERPILLLGGGVSRAAAARALPRLREMGIPVMTTWNGADRVGAEEPMYFGRPNTWGQRPANVLISQADLVVALGTRLGLQQSGFNWEEFAPSARVVQVEIERAEIEKGHPVIDVGLQADANAVLDGLCASPDIPARSKWLAYCREVWDLLPLDDPANTTAPGFVSPYAFCADLGAVTAPEDVVIPCSSGGAFTVMYQGYVQRTGQVMVSDKSLASMGYGLAGAIGAALGSAGKRTVLVEGDGGFAQNLQELATMKVNDLNLKLFIFANDGYASIRMTQRNYFGGEYLGCDTQTGLGFPDWANLFYAFGIPSVNLAPGWTEDSAFHELWESPGPAAFVVPLDPEQTYYPKISSRVRADGGMESNPLHLLSPDLPPDVAAKVFAFLPEAAEPAE